MKADENGETLFQAVCDVFSKMCTSTDALKCSTGEHQIRTCQRIGATQQCNVWRLNLRGETEVFLGLPNSWYFSRGSQTFSRTIIAKLLYLWFGERCVN